MPFGQASLKFHLPGQDFMNCYCSLVHEQLVHILAHQASEWEKLLAQHKNPLVLEDHTGLFLSPATVATGTLKNMSYSQLSLNGYLVWVPALWYFSHFTVTKLSIR